LRAPNQARQALRSAGTGHESNLHLCKSKSRIFRYDPEIAGKRKLEPTASGRASHCSD
jgi:hypothetical protein